MTYSTVKKNPKGSETAENAKDKFFPEMCMGDHSKAGGAAGDTPYDEGELLIML